MVGDGGCAMVKGRQWTGGGLALGSSFAISSSNSESWVLDPGSWIGANMA